MFAKHRSELGLTKPDVLKINRLFTRFDRDGNSMITPEEMPNFGNESANASVTQYDTDSDGTITRPEVEKAVAASRKQKGYIEEDFQKAKTMLSRHDANNSKYIEAYELFDDPKGGQLPKSVMDKADLNKDERLGLDELSRHFAAERLRK